MHLYHYSWRDLPEGPMTPATIVAPSIMHALEAISHGPTNLQGIYVQIGEPDKEDRTRSVQLPPPTGFLAQLRTLLLAQGVSPEKLSRAAGVSHGTLRRFLNYEGGLHGESIDKLLAHLGLAVKFEPQQPLDASAQQA